MRSQKPEARSQNSGIENRSPAKEFTDLLVWKMAHSLVLSIYQLTHHYYLILARDLGYSETHTLISDLEQVSRLLEVYMGAISRDIENKT